MRYFLLIVFIAFALNVSGQSSGQNNKQVQDSGRHMPVATFDLNKYISENMQYPDSAKAHNIEGRVVVKFVVDVDGSITDCKIMKGIDKDCDDEALRVVRAMPRWKPGTIDGKPVKVFFTLPIVFKLD